MQTKLKVITYSWRHAETIVPWRNYVVISLDLKATIALLQRINSIHAFEITDPSILLLSERKSHEPFATLAQTFTFSVQWVSSFMYPPPDSLVHLIYPGLTQTSSYVASPFPLCGIHITEVAADAEDFFFSTSAATLSQDLFISSTQM